MKTRKSCKVRIKNKMNKDEINESMQHFMFQLNS